MLTYDLEDRGTRTLYEFLYRKIKADIMEGRLKAHDKLPSKRNLAQHLKISVVTVENAYSQLLLEGYLYSIQKRGYFVCALEQLTKSKAQPIEIAKPDRKQQSTHCLDLTSNSICLDKFPFSVWSKLMREVLSERNTQLLNAAPYNGVEELRRAIAAHLQDFRGLAVSPEQIVVGAGTEYLYGMIIQLLGRDNVFGIENPGYKKIADIYRSNGVSYAYIGLDQSGLSVTELAKSRANILHISPAHHFPTGIVMPIKRRQELLKWAYQKDHRYIIEDEYDSEFRFNGRPIQTLQSIDANQRVIYINTFTKTIAPSIRISYMVLPEHLIKRYHQTLSFYSSTVPSFEQYTLARFISKGYFEQHLNRMRNYYKIQRDLIIDAIKLSPLAQSLSILEEDAGLHFLLKVYTNRTDAELKQVAEEQGIKIAFLSEYYYKPDCRFDKTVLINYSGVDSDKIIKAINRLAEAL